MDANGIKKNIDDGLIVSEPIKKIDEEIEKNNEKVVVLKGVRGSGRSTVLLSKAEENLKSNSFSIYHWFWSVPINVTPSEVGIDFIQHYYELYMARVLLDCVKEFNVFTEQDERIDYEITKARASFYEDANKIMEGKKISTTIAPLGYYTEDLVKEIKDLFKVDYLYFLGDHFDWMFGCRRHAQECISSYFPLFDKVVLTTDDENYSASYPTIEVNYGKDKEIIKAILKRYVLFENKKRASKKEPEHLPLDRSLGEEALDFIVRKANGDIEVILQSIDRIYSNVGYYYEEEFNRLTNEELIELWKEALDDKILYRKKIKEDKTYKGPSPKFYI